LADLAVGGRRPAVRIDVADLDLAVVGALVVGSFRPGPGGKRRRGRGRRDQDRTSINVSLHRFLLPNLAALCGVMIRPPRHLTGPARRIYLLRVARAPRSSSCPASSPDWPRAPRPAA